MLLGKVLAFRANLYIKKEPTQKCRPLLALAGACKWTVFTSIYIQPRAKKVQMRYSVYIGYLALAA